jgi:membrane protein DedA with SNARE-associated domain
MIRYLFSRLGCLIWLVGAVVLGVGIASESSGHPAFAAVAGGIALILVGFLLWNRLRPKGRKNTRFSILRRDSWEDEQDDDDEWDRK